MAAALSFFLQVVLLAFSLHLSLSTYDDAVDFNESLARFAFDHAAAAYAKNPRKCISKYHRSHLVRREMVPCDYVHDKCWYFISISNGVIVVAFRGTKTKIQLITEIVETMSQPKCNFEGGGAVQHYFNTALNAIWPTILAVLQKLTKVYPLYDILFTGHSLGGALASLASARFEYARQNTSHASTTSTSRVILVTFGQPRVGNRQFAFLHDQIVPNSFRVVHRYDLVSPHFMQRYAFVNSIS
ncbi:unnamed protein product [Toxocara canis]|uniref:Lipase_3 domain-containing protein n=1 Tax=Toxocara canis TaxID=6265 RepID=A0A183TYI2_TOXCA|nr:unnamed protein product [Toxocara canis]